MRIDNIHGLSNQGPLGGIPIPEKQVLIDVQKQYYQAFCQGGDKAAQPFLDTIKIHTEYLYNDRYITYSEKTKIEDNVISDSPEEFAAYINNNF